MKVILTQAVPGLGEAGTIKEVADGYARNYLLPRKLAMTATRGSLKQAEAQAEGIARKANKVLTEAQQAAAAVQDKTVTIRARVGSENRLYGSVTGADVSDALKAQYGIELDRRKIELGEAIHRIGTYTATAEFGTGVTAQFNVEVAPEVAGASGKASRATGESEVTTAEAAQATATPTQSDEVPVIGAAENVQPESDEVAEEQAEANPS